jgi:hypothetical protein
LAKSKAHDLKMQSNAGNALLVFADQQMTLVKEHVHRPQYSETKNMHHFSINYIQRLQLQKL